MPKIVDVEQRRADIARACWRVIVRHGIAGVTTRELAREAGISTGVLFHYFPDKEAIIYAAFEELVETFRQQMRHNVGPATTSLERLRLVALSNLPLDPSRSDEFGVWLSMWAHTYTSETLRLKQAELYQSWRDILTNLIRDAIADGSLRDDLDAVVASAQIAGITDGFVVHLLIDRGHRDITTLSVRAIDDLLDRWAAHAPAPATTRTAA